MANSKFTRAVTALLSTLTIVCIHMAYAAISQYSNGIVVTEISGLRTVFARYMFMNNMYTSLVPRPHPAFNIENWVWPGNEARITHVLALLLTSSRQTWINALINMGMFFFTMHCRCRSTCLLTQNRVYFLLWITHKCSMMYLLSAVYVSHNLHILLNMLDLLCSTQK